MARAIASARGLGGFGTARPPSLRAIILTAAAHAVAVPFAIGLGGAVIAAPEERLLMVDLAAAVPPPQPPLDPPPPDPRADILPPPLPGVPPVARPLSPAQAPALPEQATPLPAAPSSPPAAAPAAAPAPTRAPAASGPATISSNALDTTLIAGAPPRYPHDSRRQREQGTVELLVTVGTDGRVEAIAVARSSGSPRLDQAALKAVSGWRWQPLRRDGQPVKVRGLVEIPFVLTSGRKSPTRADCNPADPHCHPDGKPSRPDRRGRMDRRDGDIRHPGKDGEE